MLFDGLFSSWATPVVSWPRVAAPRLDQLLLLVAQFALPRLHLLGGVAEVAHDVNHGFAAGLELQVGAVRVLGCGAVRGGCYRAVPSGERGDSNPFRSH